MKLQLPHLVVLEAFTMFVTTTFTPIPFSVTPTPIKVLNGSTTIIQATWIAINCLFQWSLSPLFKSYHWNVFIFFRLPAYDFTSAHSNSILIKSNVSWYLLFQDNSLSLWRNIKDKLCICSILIRSNRSYTWLL